MLTRLVLLWLELTIIPWVDTYKTSFSAEFAYQFEYQRMASLQVRLLL